MKSHKPPLGFVQVGGGYIPVEYEVAASQAFKRLGGKFAKLDSNERLDLADSGDTEIHGWVQIGEQTSSSTAGNDRYVCNVALDALYEIPTDAAQTEAQLKALLAKTCDLIVSAGGLQQADIGESNEDVLFIVDYRYWGSAAGEQSLIVMLNPLKRAVAGVV